MVESSFLIKRTADAGVEVKDRYLTVTSACKDSIFTRLKPSYWVRHAFLMKQIQLKVQDGFKDRENHHLRSLVHMKGAARDEYRSHVQSEAKANATRVLAIVDQIRSYRVSTLEMLLEMPTHKLVSIARTGGSPGESWIREFITYSDALAGVETEPSENALNDARQSLPQFALEDLSELTGKDREDAASIIKLSSALRKMHMKKEHSTRTDPHAHRMPLLEASINRRRYVSAALAELIIERPGATDEIIEYVEDHKLPVTAAEVGHLREYLDTPATALVSGVL